MIEINNVIYELCVNSKKQALQAMCDKACEEFGVCSEDLIKCLIERERIGSTGIGNGVAMPHAKIEGITKIVNILLKLETPVNFDAIDDQPVDIIFLTLAPVGPTSGEQLQYLAKVATFLKDGQIAEKLRISEREIEAASVVSEWQMKRAA